MSTARSIADSAGNAQGSFGPDVAPPSQADRNRDAIADRCAELERDHPEAVDLAADVSAALHEQLTGRASEHAGNRPPKYFREQLRGAHALTLEDLCRLALHVPDAVVPALAVLARRMGYVLEAARPRQQAELLGFAGSASERFGALMKAITRAVEDGRIDAVEGHRISGLARSVQDDLVGIQVAAWKDVRAPGEGR